MIIENSICLFCNMECDHRASCKLMIERFGVLDCEPLRYRMAIVNAVHEQELESRKRLLKEIEKKKVK